ncbi:MAG: nicotinamide riboside transporter PnuC [Terracidiphilus sp.]|jgi:nicotinamide mononucleotide transporter
MSLDLIGRYIFNNWLEIIGAVTAILSIWLTTKRKIICWPIGIISDLCYLAISYHAQLFSFGLLLIGGLPLTFYGWWHWAKGVHEEGDVRVVRLPRSELVMGIAIGALGGLALGVWMEHLNASLPYLDAQLATFSVVGGWWQARKHIANWWLWIAVDLVYVGEFLYDNLRLTALLYAVFVWLAVVGLRDWRRALSQVSEMQSEAAGALN